VAYDIFSLLHLGQRLSTTGPSACSSWLSLPSWNFSRLLKWIVYVASIDPSAEIHSFLASYYKPRLNFIGFNFFDNFQLDPTSETSLKLVSTYPGTRLKRKISKKSADVKLNCIQHAILSVYDAGSTYRSLYDKKSNDNKKVPPYFNMIKIGRYIWFRKDRGMEVCKQWISYLPAHIYFCTAHIQFYRS